MVTLMVLYALWGVSFYLRSYLRNWRASRYS
jgi:hypothetical protein